MKQYTNAIIFGIAIVASSIFLGKAYTDRNKKDGEIQVTGLGKTDFSSDLIVWEGSFSADNADLKQAYLTLEEKKRTINNYLSKKGIKPEELIYSAVKTNEKTKQLYTANGEYAGQEFVGYELTQSVQIESKEVDKIEKVSREITELLNQGVQFYSKAPRYYYTKLADLKIEMISKATEDARIRAENIAKFSGGNLSDLESAKMGIFQITGQNSGEDYSWGGTFNTANREKTASITMKLVYKVD
ncbi:SIMPL domain-containing protein [Polaribacter undariae]|uniref:SIMPL domain-containing protein n=1 Tax=Polaribacter sejongensis TaxID=985043 RepID=A0AAJ1QWZ8_9FLAO|nr:SIMPL domain-containing protein [Polaribacter undariae]MDN3619627.1 SIMPL domain-containing protein [Polaribacter undariae]UWD32259.1 SIMPL domain-containing protein [Polaribacter undariae]